MQPSKRIPLRVLLVLAFLANCGKGHQQVSPTDPTTGRAPLLTRIKAAALPMPPADLGEVGLQALFELHRPGLFGAWSPEGPTTRVIPPSSFMSAHPTKETSGCCTVVSQCSGATCAEGLSVPTTSRKIINPSKRIQSLTEEYGTDSDVTAVVFAASEVDHLISAWLGSSSYTPGAAHANNSLACGTYDLQTGRQLTLSEVVPDGERVLSRLRENFDEAENRGFGNALSGYQLSARSFHVRRVDDGLEVVLCAISDITAHDGSVLEVRLPSRFKQAERLVEKGPVRPRERERR